MQYRARGSESRERLIDTAGVGHFVPMGQLAFESQQRERRCILVQPSVSSCFYGSFAHAVALQHCPASPPEGKKLVQHVTGIRRSTAAPLHRRQESSARISTPSVHRLASGAAPSAISNAGDGRFRVPILLSHRR